MLLYQSVKFEEENKGPCLLTGAMALVPVSTRDCEVTGAVHSVRVGGSWTQTYI